MLTPSDRPVLLINKTIFWNMEFSISGESKTAWCLQNLPVNRMQFTNLVANTSDTVFLLTERMHNKALYTMLHSGQSSHVQCIYYIYSIEFIYFHQLLITFQYMYDCARYIEPIKYSGVQHNALIMTYEYSAHINFVHRVHKIPCRI